MEARKETTIMRGKAHLFERDRITTEEILPARFQGSAGEADLGRHAMAGIDPEFAERTARGDIIVSGQEFGSGAAREAAVRALASARVAAVVAKSFAPAFFRDALNNGFLAIECPAAVDGIRDGDLVEIDLKDGVVRNLSRGTAFGYVPFTPFALDILEAGGLLPYVLRQTTGGSSA